MTPRLLLVFILGFGLLACGDDDEPVVDSGTPDGATDEDAATENDAGEPDGGTSPIPAIEGMTAEVEAVQDTRGMWHIYAETPNDAFRATGFLQTQDRVGQMLFLRQAVRGELTSIIPSSFDPTLVGQDQAARFLGYRRHAEVTWAALQESDPDVAAALEAYSQGVNAYLELIESGERALPRGIDSVFEIVGFNTYRRWEPVDTLAIAKFIAAAFSIEVARDLDRSASYAAFEEAFPSDASDARIAARAGAYIDLFPFEPVEKAYTTDSFPDGSTRSLTPFLDTRHASLDELLPDREMIERALPFVQSVEDQLARWFGGDRGRGSNSWVVTAESTANGNPMLVNDPHQVLPSPPLHWAAHLNTKRAGGSLNVAGQIFAGTPLVLFGYNDNIAWGLTVARHDVTDSYEETILPVEGGPDTVTFDPDPDDGNPPEQRALVTVTETIPQVGDAAPIVLNFEVVPVGPSDDPMADTRIIIPDTRTETGAISIRWTGFGVTEEVPAIFGINNAETLDGAIASLDRFQVGGINWSFVSKDETFWRAQADLPVRDPRALTFDTSTVTGTAPCFVLPGTGEYEWAFGADETLGADDQGMLLNRLLPQERNPARGFTATANADPVGVTDDGNPFNDPYYLGWRYQYHRIARIDAELRPLIARGSVTVEEMQALQNDQRSPVGALTRDGIVADLTRAVEEAETPGSHPDLTTVVEAIGASVVTTRLAMARDRLAAWTLDAPAGVEEPSAEEIADSVATAISNASLGRIHRALIDDEVEVLYPGIDCDAEGCLRPTEALYVLALSDPERLRTYDLALGDTILWDDISTDSVTETRSVIVVQAVADALTWLEERFETATMDEWRWGRIHTLRLQTTVPQLGEDVLSIPTMANEIVPGGFPRGGDRESVDVANYDARAIDDFSVSEGAIMRTVVEMTESGPRVWNAIAGGNAYDPDSPHHADEIELWRRGQAPRVPHTDEEVEAATERTLQFPPDS